MLDSLFQFHESSSVEKSKPEFGLAVAKDIDKTVLSGFAGYYTTRNAKFYQNRRIADGKQDMTQFLDLMGIDGKQSFTNVDLTAPKIATKFMELIVQRFMERDEKIQVSAIDPVSAKRKNNEKEEAEFRMANADFIKSVQAQAGVPVEDPNAFTPIDKDDLEFYFGYEFQLPEEIGFEKGINYVLVDNDWNVIKRKVLEDLSECGLGATKVYIDANNKIRIRRCLPENMMYSWSEMDDFRDITWVGEAIKMTVSEYRTRFFDEYIKLYGKNKAEEELFNDVKNAQNGDPKARLTWEQNYTYSYFRPYDDWSVEILDFELKTTDNDVYVAKENDFGRVIAVDKKKKAPEAPGDKKKVINTPIYNIYHGFYVRRINKIFCWGKAKNMIRPQSNLSDVFFSYSLHMYRNRDMINVALPERISSSVNQMTLAHLKIQQLIAKMRPAGLQVDIKGITGIDLGLGNVMQPLEIQKVYDQTGNLYYKSWDEDPDHPLPPPIKELANSGSVAQLQELVTIYNFYLSRLRDDLGTNEFNEGAGQVSGKTSPTLAQNQVISGNRATEFIYDSYMNLFRNTSRRVAILLWDNIIYDGGQYREFIGQGKLEESRFDIDVEPMQTAEDVAQLNQNIAIALQEQSITFLDAEKIRNIDNTKLAYMYLAKAQKKNREDKIAEQQASIQATAQAQMQSAQATSQGKMQEAQNKAQIDAQLQQMKDKNGSELSMQEFVQNLLMESFKQNKPLPPNLQEIVDAYFTGKARQEMAEQQINQQMIQAAQQQQDPNAPVPSPEEEQAQMQQMGDAMSE